MNWRLTLTAAPTGYLDGQGHLVIKALATGSGMPAGDTSARLLTQGLFSRSHGDFEARIKVRSHHRDLARVVDDR